jgi:polysaccharide biosynthesis transport protein
MMLETNAHRTLPKLESNAPQETGVGEIIESAVLFARRRYVIIAATGLLAICLAVLYLKVTPPTFTASADVILSKHENQFVQQQVVLAASPMDAYSLESEIQIVRSDNVTAAVVKRLHLDGDPEFVGSGGGLLTMISGLWRTESALNDFQRTQQAALVLEKNTEVARVGMSYVIEISYSSTNPEKSALIANAIAEEFIAEQRNAKKQESRTAGDWSFERATQLRQQTEAAERAVNEFKKDNNIFTVGGNLLNEQQVSELTAQIAMARQKTAEALARVNQISSPEISNPSTNPIDATASIDSIANPALTKLRQKYMDLSAQEREWSRKYGESYWAAVGLRNQMNDMRQPIQDEIRRLREAYKGDYDAAKQRQEAIERDLAKAVSDSQTANRAQITLRELESAAHSDRALYESFMQRSTESVQQESFPLNDARVISPAVAPAQKSRPKSMLVLALAIFGGGALGIGLGLLRDLLDGAFRTGRQVENSLLVPCIALVPRTRRASVREPKNLVAKGNSSRVIQLGTQIFWRAATEPASRFTEAIRSIKFALDLASAVNGRKKIVGLTSALPNEGKSSITAALALLAAQVGARAVVVDLDLRNPTLSRTLAPNAEHGIVDVLLGHSSLDETLWIEPTSNLAMLPVSARGRHLHTTEILGSRAMRQLFDELHQRFEYVIVDLPPLVPVVDARATTEIIDNYFLVVEWGRTKTSVVVKALDSAAAINERLVGAILNKADIRNMGRYDTLSKTYYNNADFARYGYTD